MIRTLVSGVLVAAMLVACGAFSADPSPTAGDDSGIASGNDGASDGAAPQSDAAPGDEASTYCWPYRPANYDPCVAGFEGAHPSAAAQVVSSNVPLDTDAAADTIADGASTYALYRFASLTVTASGTLTIKGSRPALIIVDGDVQIDGSVVVIASSVGVPSECGAPPSVGSSTTNWSGGGGGGGYGGVGGAGGSGHTGGTANGNSKVAPLRAGCPGGTSGTPMPVSNQSKPAANLAPGGLGGGALEISARGMLVVGNTASVVANGTGGAGGDAHTSGNSPCLTADGKSCDSGGGGGGSGGSIVLEANRVNVMGSVCAVGGGGGAGGAEGGNPGASGGASPSCAAATGGTTPIAGGAGGTTADGTSATAPCGSYTSCGGGGGAAGRIRIRSSSPLVVTGLVVPSAYTL